MGRGSWAEAMSIYSKLDMSLGGFKFKFKSSYVVGLSLANVNKLATIGMCKIKTLANM